MIPSGAFLSSLTAEDRAALQERWTVHEYGRNEMILAHEETSRDVFFLLEGHARATTYSESGRAVAYRDIEPGDIFGELAAIDGGPRSAAVVAVDRVRAAVLRASAFEKLVATRPTLAWALLSHLSLQVRRLTERVYEFSTLVVRKRLIRELLRMAGDQQDAGDLAFIRPAPTHSELAAKIGTHREAVSREMSTLAKMSLVKKEGRALELHGLGMLRLLSSGED